VAREEIKGDIDAKTEEAFVKAMVEETTKLDKEAEEVIKEVVATVEPVVEEKVEEVEEVEEVVEKVKKGRKAKAK
jgi:TRAP-type mannitol/chloroaromatic compound transport system substrate-binding protein